MGTERNLFRRGKESERGVAERGIAPGLWEA
jgi:hypothetical protein